MPSWLCQEAVTPYHVTMMPRNHQDLDDGGFPGGSMERPALTRLLADIQSGRVDVVIAFRSHTGRKRP